MLIVVRHGRTASNAQGLLLGRADPDLDDLGREQAAAVGAVLAGGRGTDGGAPDGATGAPRVVCSPLRRARATAAVVAERCGAGAPVVDERWIELDYGELDGVPVEDVPVEVWNQWRLDPDFAPAGGESLRALRARVDAAAGEWLADPVPTVVVTHVSPIKAVLGWALGLDEAVNWRSFVTPGSLTRITAGDRGPVLRSFNEVPWLTVA